ncbi:NUDIX hydrolase [Ruegeria lacuscaerulensis]|uniref:NUDIX hydrolase n=1 Tax=Ruegeria lacuscaerulensis TaxID=55218 RepID=UPI0030135786
MLQQAAALCCRTERGWPEVLLITTRRSRNWIIPKGWLIDGFTACQSARQEAWEEAGVRGKCFKQPVGRFSYQKHRSKKGSALCIVDVFPLFVQSMAADFPECGQRQRKWFSPEKAASRVNIAELATLLRKIGPDIH